MDKFKSMKRRELQALCKKHGIPANLTNQEMVNRLSSILKENENPDSAELSSSTNLVDVSSELDSKVVPERSKKVRFSPENETFIFISSDTETTAIKKPVRRGKFSKKLKDPLDIKSIDAIDSESTAIGKQVERRNSGKKLKGSSSADVESVAVIDKLLRARETNGIVKPVKRQLRSRGKGGKEAEDASADVEDLRKNSPLNQQRRITRQSKRTVVKDTGSELNYGNERVENVGRTTRSKSRSLEKSRVVTESNENVVPEAPLRDGKSRASSSKRVEAIAIESGSETGNVSLEFISANEEVHKPRKTANGRGRNSDKAKSVPAQTVETANEDPIDNKIIQRSGNLAHEVGIADITVASGSNSHEVLPRRSRRKSVHPNYIQEPVRKKQVRSSGSELCEVGRAEITVASDHNKNEVLPRRFRRKNVYADNILEPVMKENICSNGSEQPLRRSKRSAAKSESFVPSTAIRASPKKQKRSSVFLSAEETRELRNIAGANGVVYGSTRNMNLREEVTDSHARKGSHTKDKDVVEPIFADIVARSQEEKQTLVAEAVDIENVSASLAASIDSTEGEKDTLEPVENQDNVSDAVSHKIVSPTNASGYIGEPSDSPIYLNDDSKTMRNMDGNICLRYEGSSEDSVDERNDKEDTVAVQVNMSGSDAAVRIPESNGPNKEESNQLQSGSISGSSMLISEVDDDIALLIEVPSSEPTAMNAAEDDENVDEDGRIENERDNSPKHEVSDTVAELSQDGIADPIAKEEKHDGSEGIVDNCSHEILGECIQELSTDENIGVIAPEENNTMTEKNFGFVASLKCEEGFSTSGEVIPLETVFQGKASVAVDEHGHREKNEEDGTEIDDENEKPPYSRRESLSVGEDDSRELLGSRFLIEEYEECTASWKRNASTLDERTVHLDENASAIVAFQKRLSTSGEADPLEIVFEGKASVAGVEHGHQEKNEQDGTEIEDENVNEPGRKSLSAGEDDSREMLGSRIQIEEHEEWTASWKRNACILDEKTIHANENASALVALPTPERVGKSRFPLYKLAVSDANDEEKVSLAEVTRNESKICALMDTTVSKIAGDVGDEDVPDLKFVICDDLNQMVAIPTSCNDSSSHETHLEFGLTLKKEFLVPTQSYEENVASTEAVVVLNESKDGLAAPSPSRDPIDENAGAVHCSSEMKIDCSENQKRRTASLSSSGCIDVVDVDEIKGTFSDDIAYYNSSAAHFEAFIEENTENDWAKSWQLDEKTSTRVHSSFPSFPSVLDENGKAGWELFTSSGNASNDIGQGTQEACYFQPVLKELHGGEQTPDTSNHVNDLFVSEETSEVSVERLANSSAVIDGVGYLVLSPEEFKRDDICTPKFLGNKFSDHAMATAERMSTEVTRDVPSSQNHSVSKDAADDERCSFESNGYAENIPLKHAILDDLNQIGGLMKLCSSNSQETNPELNVRLEKETFTPSQCSERVQNIESVEPRILLTEAKERLGAPSHLLNLTAGLMFPPEKLKSDNDYIPGLLGSNYRDHEKEKGDRICSKVAENVASVQNHSICMNDVDNEVRSVEVHTEDSTLPLASEYNNPESLDSGHQEEILGTILNDVDNEVESVEVRSGDSTLPLGSEYNDQESLDSGHQEEILGPMFNTVDSSCSDGHKNNSFDVQKEENAPVFADEPKAGIADGFELEEEIVSDYPGICSIRTAHAGFSVEETQKSKFVGDISLPLLNNEKSGAGNSSFHLGESFEAGSGRAKIDAEAKTYSDRDGTNNAAQEHSPHSGNTNNAVDAEPQEYSYVELASLEIQDGQDSETAHNIQHSRELNNAESDSDDIVDTIGDIPYQDYLVNETVLMVNEAVVNIECLKELSSEQPCCVDKKRDSEICPNLGLPSHDKMVSSMDSNDECHASGPQVIANETACFTKSCEKTSISEPLGVERGGIAITLECSDQDYLDHSCQEEVMGTIFDQIACWVSDAAEKYAGEAISDNTSFDAEQERDLDRDTTPEDDKVELQQQKPESPPNTSFSKQMSSSKTGRTKGRSDATAKTPKKSLHAYDMKENLHITKEQQLGSVTAAKSVTKRKALEDLKQKLI